MLAACVLDAFGLVLWVVVRDEGALEGAVVGWLVVGWLVGVGAGAGAGAGVPAGAEGADGEVGVDGAGADG